MKIKGEYMEIDNVTGGSIFIGENVVFNSDESKHFKLRTCSKVGAVTFFKAIDNPCPVTSFLVHYKIVADKCRENPLFKTILTYNLNSGNACIQFEHWLNVGV